MIYPNPRHLRAFVTLAEVGSFGGAAKLLHIGQPALSQAIAGLEELVGVRLLERTTRSLSLTPAGVEFLNDARRVLEANELLLQRGVQWAQARRGRIALLSIPSVAHRLLPAIVREFNQSHPEVDVEVHDHADPVLRQRLDRGEGDLAILTILEDAAGRHTLPFLRDRFRVVLPAEHPLARQDAVEAAQLAGERLILLRRGALFRSYMDVVLSRLQLRHAPLEVDQPGTLLGMVEGGLGLSLLPALSCPTPALRSVVSRPLLRPEVSRLIGFARPADRSPMPVVKALVDALLDHLAAHADTLPAGCERVPASAQKIRRFLEGKAPGAADK